MKLHTVNQSPHQGNKLQRCLSMVQPGAAILLIEDGVYAALASSEYAPLMQQAATGCALYALESDVAARGIGGQVMKEIKLINYDAFVDLVVESSSTISW